MRSPIRAPLIEGFMDKNFLLNEINKLIEAKRLWGEMNEHIFALGGELWETKYAEAYNFHEELVFKLIILYRGYKEYDDFEFEAFQDCIYDLSHGHTTSVKIIIDEEPGYEIRYISNAEELLNSHLDESYPKEIPF